MPAKRETLAEEHTSSKREKKYTSNRTRDEAAELERQRIAQALLNMTGGEVRALRSITSGQLRAMKRLLQENLRASE